MVLHGRGVDPPCAVAFEGGAVGVAVQESAVVTEDMQADQEAHQSSLGASLAPPPPRLHTHIRCLEWFKFFAPMSQSVCACLPAHGARLKGLEVPIISCALNESEL